MEAHMPRVRWSGRAGVGTTTIVAVTSRVAELDAVADELATPGRLVAACTPDELGRLLTQTRFDLLVLLTDVDPRERARLASMFICFGQRGEMVEMAGASLEDIPLPPKGARRSLPL